MGPLYRARRIFKVGAQIQMWLAVQKCNPDFLAPGLLFHSAHNHVQVHGMVERNDSTGGGK